MSAAASQPAVPQPVPQPHELVLKPSRGMSRTLKLKCDQHNSVTAFVLIGESAAMVAYAVAELERVRIRTENTLGTFVADIWLDQSSFDLTPAELPRVEAWLAAVRVAS